MLLASVGSDLPYLTGYEAMPLERLTMAVIPLDGDAILVVPELEAPRVDPQPGVFAVEPGARPRIRSPSSHGLPVRRARVAVTDQTWSVFLLDLQQPLPER